MSNFSVPTRIDYVPSPLEPDEDGVQDIGYRKGKLCDGRPYRLECWRMDDMVMCTVMFDDLGLSTWTKLDMYLLLELDNIISFPQGYTKLQAARVEDDLGQPVWALNMLLSNKKGVYGEIVGPLNRYVI